MTFRLGKEFEDCSSNAETCQIVQELFGDDAFYAIAEAEDNDPLRRMEAATCRQIIGNLLVMCVNGNCPGKNPELTDEYLKRKNSGE